MDHNCDDYDERMTKEVSFFNYMCSIDELTSGKIVSVKSVLDGSFDIDIFEPSTTVTRACSVCTTCTLYVLLQ